MDAWRRKQFGKQFLLDALNDGWGEKLLTEGLTVADGSPWLDKAERTSISNHIHFYMSLLLFCLLVDSTEADACAIANTNFPGEMLGLRFAMDDDGAEAGLVADGVIAHQF